MEITHYFPHHYYSFVSRMMPQLSILLLALTFPPPVWLLPIYADTSSLHLLVHTVCSSYPQIFSIYLHTVLILRLCLSWNILPFPSAYRYANHNSTPRLTSFIKLSLIAPSFTDLSSSDVYWLLVPMEFVLAFHSTLTQGRLWRSIGLCL